ncbi:nucleoside hydrolase [Patescibacteria group bacterium]|nr:nucleoside hydrolase [Patescibacteria group bacterium]
MAEFNIWYDPESAKAVFAATDNIVLIPLDVTQSMVYTMADTERFLSAIDHSVKAEFMRQLTAFAISTNTKFRETHYEQ